MIKIDEEFKKLKNKIKRQQKQIALKDNMLKEAEKDALIKFNQIEELKQQLEQRDKRVEELERFVESNHILLRKYRDDGTSTNGGKLYWKSKELLTNKQIKQ